MVRENERGESFIRADRAARKVNMGNDPARPPTWSQATSSLARMGRCVSALGTGIRVAVGVLARPQHGTPVPGEDYQRRAEIGPMQ
jgi:hypothetical protein